jgi:hypothetical protein
VKLGSLRLRNLGFRKVTGVQAEPPETEAPEGDMTAIVKVSEDGYVPEGVRCRAQIADRIFTADLSPEQLRQLDDDPRVVSVEASERLGTN